jgi:hypothetical protein
MSAEPITSDDLVAGRECGSCTVCCRMLKISAPELKKLAGMLCQHCTGAGCGIYEKRPAVCGGYYCGWRGMAYLTEHWRPDRCGVLISFLGKDDGIPPEFEQVGLKFDVDEPRVLAWDPLIKFIGAEIERGRAVFLGVPAQIGYERRKVFLNYAMAGAVKSRQRDQMIASLEAAFRVGLQDATREKTIFD